MLDRLVQASDLRVGCLGPPSFFGETDSVLSCNSAAPIEYLFEEIIQWQLRALLRIGVGGVHHHVDMNVAVAGMAETRNGQPMLLLQTGSKTKQVLQPATRDHDVLIEF